MATLKKVPQYRTVRRRILQNYLAVWLDANADLSNNDIQSNIEQLRNVINSVTLFNTIEDSLKFLKEIESEKIFVITSAAFAQTLVPQIHSMKAVNTIYICDEYQPWYGQWASEWPKVKGLHPTIQPLIEIIHPAAKRCDQDTTPISYARMNETNEQVDLNRLQPSYMYTQIFKNAILNTKYDNQSSSMLIEFCRDQFQDNLRVLAVVDEFSQAYQPDKAIWWYTKDCFVYPMLNRALRLLESDVIVYMSFFIHDLHRQIEELYKEQACSYGDKSFDVYRGQRLSIDDFHQLEKSQEGLIAFNSFISTSQDAAPAYMYADSATQDLEVMGILFIMTIDPKLDTTSFAHIRNISAIEDEDEVLFSMHAVFRINKIEKDEVNDRLFRVFLSLTNDNDPELRVLTMQIEQEDEEVGWTRMGDLLIYLGKLETAENLFLTLLDQNLEDQSPCKYYHALGKIKSKQRNHKEAIQYYEQALEEHGKSRTSDKLFPTHTYNHIGMVYRHTGDYSKALSYHEKALDIQLKILPSDHPEIAISYNNLGSVHHSMGDYPQALSYYKQALGIQQKHSLANHPMVATFYSNIALIYDMMTDHTKGLACCEKVFDIQQKSLPADHSHFATSYNNIGFVYCNMNECSKALACFEKALDIQKKNYPEEHPDIATSYNNIGSAYDKKGDYLRALSYYEQALAVQQKNLPEHHPDTINSFNNIGLMYEKIGKYSEALSYFEKVLAIQQKLLDANHPDLATYYNNIGSLHCDMGEYSKALFYFEEALKIRQKHFSEKHPDIAASYNNIGS
ncbi:unnamed protein product, partial [Adineta ricciae]